MQPQLIFPFSSFLFFWQLFFLSSCPSFYLSAAQYLSGTLCAIITVISTAAAVGRLDSTSTRHKSEPHFFGYYSFLAVATFSATATFSDPIIITTAFAILAYYYCSLIIAIMHIWAHSTGKYILTLEPICQKVCHVAMVLNYGH